MRLAGLLAIIVVLVLPIGVFLGWAVDPLLYRLT